ncbi:MAG: phosphorylase [Archaeoglobaceae archaeon]|nr:phosphorylase [Archaeoglobaceae archaeon]
MAKKGAIGAKHVVIDIPYGEGAKIESGEMARALANDFIELGKRLGLDIVCALTYGGQPIGRAVGPALEAREALDGYSYAKSIFESGKTLEKFREIVSAQGGDEKVKADDIPVGDKTFTITSGAPKDKGAGVYIHKKRGEVVKAGDPLITIYAEKDWKLENAIEVARSDPPILVSGMILEVYGKLR